VSDLPYKFIAGLAGEMPVIPADSIISRTLYSDSAVKVILFGFAPGQELSEHTSARRAMLHFVDGCAEVRLGSDIFEAQTGSFVYLPPHLPHSVTARAETRMLLVMVEADE
jgi:quercetin dioxygenase-like cupin family protein